MLPLILSFIIATIWVSLSTVIAERCGTKTGGVISTLPSTLIVALFFMAVEEGAVFASKAAIVVPVEMGVNVVFLGVLMHFMKKGMGKAIAIALGVWFTISFAIYLAQPSSMILSIIAFVLFVIATRLWMSKGEEFRQQEGKDVKYTPREILFRGTFAGAIIALAVFVATISGPVLGAIFSVFPAIFISTMAILYLRQGHSFTGAAGTTMIIGSSNVVVYATVAYYAFPIYGQNMGTLITVVLSYIWSFGVFVFVNKYLD